MGLCACSALSFLLTQTISKFVTVHLKTLMLTDFGECGNTSVSNE